MNSPCRNALAIGLASWCLWAGAAPLPGGLQVQASVSLDGANSIDPSGGATQAGTLSLTSSGTTSSSSFTDTPSSISPDLLSGALLATGDGIGIQFSMSGSFAGAAATTDGLFGDYALLFTNSSATETYTVSLRATTTHAVGATGADAFAFSDLSILDAALAELFFTDHRIDTLNAGDPNVNFTAESPSNVFEITLLPGQSSSLTALQRQRGGVFASGDYSASLMAFLSIDNVRVSGGGGGPNPVPLPGTLVLLGAGLIALAAARRRA